MNVYAIKIDTSLNDINSFIPLLSEERIKKINKYIYENVRKISILSEILVKYTLYKEYRFSPHFIIFEYNEFGKPFLKDCKDIFFNISHSGNWIVCTVSESPVGIDVEGKTSDVIPIAQKFFSEYENEYIRSGGLNNQDEMFCKIWTLKESYLKCIGKGLTIPLNSFSFEFHRDEILLYKDNVRISDFFFMNKKIDNDHYLSVCVNADKPDIENLDITMVSVENLLLWKENMFR